MSNNLLGVSMELDNGWYEWKPNDCCDVEWLSLHQIVQVIEGVVWATNVSQEVTVCDASYCGEFVRKIELED